MLLSPCINHCRMDAASGLCLGCFRNIDEIAIWSRADDATRAAILASLTSRRQAHEAGQAGGMAEATDKRHG